MKYVLFIMNKPPFYMNFVKITFLAALALSSCGEAAMFEKGTSTLNLILCNNWTTTLDTFLNDSFLLEADPSPTPVDRHIWNLKYFTSYQPFSSDRLGLYGIEDIFYLTTTQLLKEFGWHILVDTYSSRNIINSY